MPVHVYRKATMKHSIKNILRQILTLFLKPFFRKGINIRIGHAGRFCLDPFFVFSRFKDFGNNHNSGFKRWLMACSGKRTIFDIGAYVGLYTIPVSRVIKEGGIIHAFEPSMTNRKYLERHIYFNRMSNVKTYPYLIGKKPMDKAAFFEKGHASGMDSVAIWKDHSSYSSVFRKQVTLDGFCRQINTIPEVIKIDVEGSEFDVLKGGALVIEKHKPIIFLSVHPKRLGIMGQSTKDLADFVQGLGYILYNSSGEKVKDLKFNEYIALPDKKDFYEIFQ